MVPAQGRQQRAGQQQGPKPWVIWMLFGLGWASLLFFGLSVIPAFPGGVQWSLWAFGWLFVLCWWAGTLMGAGHTEDKRVKVSSCCYRIVGMRGSCLQALLCLGWACELLYVLFTSL
jgi:hypothetical protein